MPTAARKAREDARDARPRDDREAERITRQIVAEYERHRSRPRSIEYARASRALVARVLERGGWLQIAGLRFLWSTSEGPLIRQAISPHHIGLKPPTKV